MKINSLSLFFFALTACSSNSGSRSSGDAGTTSSTTTSTTTVVTLPDGATTTVTTSTTGTSTTTSDASTTTGTTSTTAVTPGSYALPAPNACSNINSDQNCRKGVATSDCGGVCASDYGPTNVNVCSGGISGVPVNYACPRDMLYSDEMNQAVIDDGYGGQINYAIVGHDPDSTGIDSGVSGAGYASCCQCYQLVFDYPKENQAWVNPNGTAPQPSAITAPMPLVVQSANTATNGPDDFDIFMGAGGFGANNGCYVSGGTCPGGPCMYTAFPSFNGGGLNVAGNALSNLSPDPCKNTTSWVTEATLTSSACASATESACAQITSANAQIQAETQRSCYQSNGVGANDAGTTPGDYHINWFVWAKRVECPAHLTEVTGCKLASQGLPAVDPTIQTVAQAQAAGFKQNAGTGTAFNTTQMQDCCMPSCAFAANTASAAPKTGGYDTMYSCDINGAPWTTAITRTQ